MAIKLDIRFTALALTLFVSFAPALFAAEKSVSTEAIPAAPNAPAEDGADSVPPPEAAQTAAAPAEYTVGIDDVLTIDVLQPDKLSQEFVVSPDGYISFPYIGSVLVKDRTLGDIEREIQKKLANGYLQYPVVSVQLKLSRSKRFFVYGEVTNPGAYALDENMTVFKALSIAGGFTKFGSSSRVKILRPKVKAPGYEMLKVDIKAIMNGSTEADILLRPGDVVAVSEGMF